MNILGPTLAVGIPFLLASIFFTYMKRWEKRGSSLVVDDRTLKLTTKRVADYLEAGEVTQARYAMTSIVMWLRSESTVGPKRRRESRATELAYWERLRADLPAQHAELAGAEASS